MSDVPHSKQFISKASIKRLIGDVKEMRNTPLTSNGIYYHHDETDMLKGYAMIVGQENTPYYGGFYFFEFTFPTDYPHRPPAVKYYTNGDNVRFHPNFYKNGKVCVSILNTWRGDQWTSCQSISSVLLTLCSLLSENPLINEPGVTKSHRDMKSYNTIVTAKNVEISLLRMLKQEKGYFHPMFQIFYDDMKKIYAHNQEAIKKHVANVRNMIVELSNGETGVQVTTHMYTMNVFLSSDIINQLQEEATMHLLEAT